MEENLLKQALKMSAKLPYSLAFIIVFFLVIALLGDRIPQRFDPMLWLVVVLAFASLFWEIHNRRKLQQDAAKSEPDKPLEAAPEVIQPALSAAHKPVINQRDLYLLEMKNRWNRLRLPTRDGKDSDFGQRAIGLDQVYTHLDTTHRVDVDMNKGGDKKNAADLRPQRDAPQSAIGALAEASNGCLMLTGEPGSGKSTFARHICAELVNACTDSGYDWQSGLPGWTQQRAMLPVMLSLGAFARGHKDAALQLSELEQFLGRQAEVCDDLRGFAADLLVELKTHGGLVCFDGLDEVAESQRGRIRELIVMFAESHKRCHVLVTSRVHSYYAKAAWQFTQWDTRQIAPLSDAKMGEFIHAWYDAKAHFDMDKPEGFYPGKRDRLIQALRKRDRRGLHKLAQIPLLLTTMAIVHTDKELPNSRVEVFESCIDILLLYWERDRDAERLTILQKLDKYTASAETYLRRAMNALAYQTIDQQAGDDNRAVIGEGVLNSVLRQHFKGESQDDIVREFLAYCRDGNGLLLYSGEQKVVNAPETTPLEAIYVFPHSYFQEYLAAVNLQGMHYQDLDLIALAGQSDWREVMLFYLEQLTFLKGGQPGQIRWFIEQVLQRAEAVPASETGTTDGETAYKALELTIEYIARAGELAECDSACVQRIGDLLLAMIDSACLADDAVYRAAIGNHLARLGDSRAGVAVQPNPDSTLAIKQAMLPDIRWVSIPRNAALKLGHRVRAEPELVTDDDEFWERDDSLVVEAFELAAYPVTVAQYRLFVEAGGYEDEDLLASCWTDAGRAEVLDEEGRREPWGWSSQQAQDNHPVIGVSWYEAMAWCRWANTVMQPVLSAGAVLRLPTEAEWEWAARGQPGYRWPAGNDWKTCNNGDSGIGRTSAVGMFPAAAAAWPSADSPEGRIYDQVGNVWEWCLTKWQDQYSDAWQAGEWSEGYLSGDDWRVLRGGSWRHDASRCRGAARFWYGPGYGNYVRGFRCCVATSSLASAS